MALESIRINALDGRRIGGRRALKCPETLMHHYLQIRFTLRQARWNPGFALTTILTLAAPTLAIRTAGDPIQVIAPLPMQLVPSTAISRFMRSNL
jgi:hypothetical protein